VGFVATVVLIGGSDGGVCLLDSNMEAKKCWMANHYFSLYFFFFLIIQNAIRY